MQQKLQVVGLLLLNMLKGINLHVTNLPTCSTFREFRQYTLGKQPCELSFDVFD